MADYVVMPKSDYQNTCDSIRAKTGATELLKSGDLSTAIDSIQAGGGEVGKPYLDTSTITDFTRFSYAGRLSNAQLETIDTSSGTTFYEMFYSSSKLTTIPQLDTSNGTQFSHMFSGCRLITTIPQLDTSNGTGFIGMFQNCVKLTTIPQLNTSNGTQFNSMFSGCSKLTTIPQLDTSNGVNFSSMFSNCSALTTISFTQECIKASISFSGSPLLSDASIQSIVDGLADLTSSTAQTLTLHADVKAKLTEEQTAAVTAKNWTIA